MKLTKASVQALKIPYGKTEAILFDDDVPGFGIRLREGGSRTWIVQYKTGDKHRRITLGTIALLDPAKARESARGLLAQVRLGRDPAGDKANSRAQATETLGAIAEQFLARQQRRLRPRSYTETERYVRVHWKPLHGLTLNKVSRATVAARLNVIAKQSGPAAADKARADLSALFTWAMREGLVEANPVIATNTATENKARDRVLTNSELTGIWRALGEDHYSSIVRLLILTGQRRDEIAALRWSEVNTAKRLICFEGARTKNSLPHDVPLSDATLAIIEAQPIRAGREHVFGEGKGGFQGFSKCKATLDAKLGAAVPPWRLHDLRRSAATGMAELGVLPHVVEAVLNHISGHKKGVAGTYNRAVYANEKRIALDMWGQHVMRLVEGREAKVVAFPGKRA